MVYACHVIQFLYPSSPLSPKKVDETYQEEYEAVRTHFPALFSLEPFLPDTEQRYFVFQGKVGSSDNVISDVVQKAVEKVSCPFFTVDVIQRSDGMLRIVELGDGQVSDRKQWTPEQFLKIFQK